MTTSMVNGAAEALSTIRNIYNSDLKEIDQLAELRRAQVDIELMRSSWVADEFRRDFEAGIVGGSPDRDSPFVLKLIIETIPSLAYHLQRDLEEMSHIIEKTPEQSKVINATRRIPVETLAAHALTNLFANTFAKLGRNGGSQASLLNCGLQMEDMLEAEHRCMAILAHPDSDRYRKKLAEGKASSINWVYKQLGLLTELDAEGVGHYIINKTLEVTHLWFSVYEDQKRNFGTYIRPTDELSKLIQTKCDNVTLWASSRSVMYCPPVAWDDEGVGGFMTSTDALQTGLSLDKKGKKGCEISGDWSRHLRALNALQSVPYQVNNYIADVQRKLFWEHGGGVCGMPRRDVIGVEPEWSDVKKRSIINHNRTSIMPQALWMSRRIDFSAEHKDIPKLWFVTGVDARGRVRYLTGDHPNVHGSDLDRGVLQFANPTILGTKGLAWLMVGVATEVGHDKLSFNKRAAWTNDNIDMLRRIVSDPIGRLEEWKDWDNPFRALALAEDLLKAIDSRDPSQYISHSMIGFDATNSAIQIIGALTGDEELMKYSNVLPMDDGSRGDFYLEIGDKMHQLLFDDERVWPEGFELEKLQMLCKDGIPRLISKRSMMATYGSTSIYGQADGMSLILSDVWPELHTETGHSIWTTDGMPESPQIDYVPFNERNYEDEEDEQAKYGVAVIGLPIRQSLARLLLEAMALRFPNLSEYLAWTSNFAAGLGRADRAVSWKTPIGMTISNEYLMTRRETVSVLGSTLSLGRRVVDGRLDSRKMSTALPPNYIHSIDAAFLMQAIWTLMERCIYEIGTVHDCILVPPGKSTEVLEVLRQTFLDMFRGKDFLQELYDDNTIDLPEDAEVPDLFGYTRDVDMTPCLRSEYFWS